MFDPLKDYPGTPARNLQAECLNSYLKKLLGNLLKPYLKKPEVSASEEFSMGHLKEALEKLFEELPVEHRERHHRPCRWL